MLSSREILRRIRHLGVARPRDLPDVHRARLKELCQAGLLERIGLDVALEALHDYRRLHRGKIDQLWQYAAVCRIRSILQPYLEAG